MNTNRRQFLKLTAALTTAAALAASARGAFAADKIKVGFSQGTMNHPWRIAMVEVNKKFAAENYPEIELIVTDGNNDASKQVADVESLLAQGINVLVISPLTAQALTPVVKDAMASGIPVLTLDRKVNTEVTCHMGGANLPLGEGAAKFLINALPDGAKIIELQGTAGASATLDRHKMSKAGDSSQVPSSARRKAWFFVWSSVLSIIMLKAILRNNSRCIGWIRSAAACLRITAAMVA